MNKKNLIFGAMALSLGALLVTPTADAFWGGRGGEMSQEKFTEMQQMIQSFTSVEDFNAAMKTKREEMKVDHEAMQNLVSRTVEKIDNGIVMTVTTEDADTLAKMKERHANMAEKKMKNENITQSVVALDNGFKTTLTTEDPATLLKLQARSENAWNGMGMGRGNHKGDMNENMKGKRGGNGKGMGKKIN